MDRRRLGMLLGGIGALLSAVVFPYLRSNGALTGAVHFTAGLCLGMALAIMVGATLRRRGLASDCAA